MPISFECPQCGKKLRAPDQSVGKSSKCPGCGAIVTCPEPIYDAEVIDVSEALPSDILDNDKPYSLVDPQPSAASSDEDRRPCPMCGEMILKAAAKCRYCGEVFDPGLKKAKGTKSRKYDSESEYLTGGEMTIAVLPMCAGIGCIVGIVYMIQGRPKGLKMFGLSLVMAILWSFVRIMLQSAIQQPGIPGGP